MKNKEAKEMWFDHKLDDSKIDLVDDIWKLMSVKQRKEQLNSIKEMHEEVEHCDCPDCLCGDKGCPGKEALEEEE